VFTRSMLSLAVSGREPAMALSFHLVVQILKLLRSRAGSPGTRYVTVYELLTRWL